MNEQKGLSGFTKYALQCYDTLAKTKRKAEEKEMLSAKAIAKIPEEDMDDYMRITTEIQKQQDTLLETFVRRRFKKRPGT